MYLQRMGRKTFRLRLPVTFALVLLAILLAFAVAGCSFGNGDPKPPRSKRRRTVRSSYPTDAASTWNAGDQVLLPSSLKWDKTSLAPIFTKCRRLLPANI